MKTFIIIMLFAYSSLDAQNTSVEGNLIQINFIDDIVDTANTIGSWHEYNTDIDYTTQYYIDVINSPNQKYLLGYFAYIHEYFPTASIGNFLFNTLTDSAITIFCHDIGCGLPGYYSPNTPTVYEIPTGIWIVNDFSGNAFLRNDDSLFASYDYQYDYMLLHICGKIDTLHLVAVMNYINAEVELHMADLSISPNLYLENSIPIEFPGDEKPLKVIRLKNDLYIISILYESKLKLYSFQESSFHYIKTLMEADFNDWTFRNNKIIGQTSIGNKIVKYEYNNADTTFGEEHVIFEGRVSIDNQFMYAANIDETTLNLIEIDNEQISKTWDIRLINQPSRVFLDTANIFVHQVTSVTDIKEIEALLPETFELYQNYPNPFNPITTIRFTIAAASVMLNSFQHPNGETPKQVRGDNIKVQLKIYDILGNEITTLVNEQKPAGIYEIEFDGNGLTSGIYFYKLTEGQFSETRKMLLMK